MVASARIRSALANERGRVLAVWILLGIAAAVSVVFLGYSGRGQSLKGDEWGYAHRPATEPMLQVAFDTGPGKYLLVVPMIVYKLAFSTIGIGEYLPYRLLGMALTTAIAGSRSSPHGASGTSRPCRAWS